MPEVQVEKTVTLDLLSQQGPALSSTDDMPVVETKPDAANEGSPPAPESEEEEGKTEAKSDAPQKPEDSSASAKAKPAKGVQKRIDELTRQREEAQRRAEAAEAREKLALEALKGRPEQKPEPKAEDESEPKKPAKSEFTDPDAYEAAVDEYIARKAEWTARREVDKRIAEQNQKAMDEAIKRQEEAVRQAHQARRTKALEKYPDFAEVAETEEVSVPMPVAIAIQHAEEGPDLQYYFGKHPEEAKRMFDLNPAAQLVELGKIAAKLVAPAKSVSNAPPPIKPLKPDVSSARSSDEEPSMEEYAARRKPELQKQMSGRR